MSGAFKSCTKCIPPKRKPGFQDICPDYQREWRENQKILQAKYAESAVRAYEVNAHARMGSKSKGINHHAK